MNRNRPILCKSALACIALAALLGGPRLSEASNDFARRIAEHEAKCKCSTPASSGSTEKQNDAPSFTASPDVCVSKSDTDGRWSFAIDICDCAAVIRPAAGHLVTDIRNWGEPVVSLHAPVFNATAPPDGTI